MLKGLAAHERATAILTTAPGTALLTRGRTEHHRTLGAALTATGPQLWTLALLADHHRHTLTRQARLSDVWRHATRQARAEPGEQS